MEEDELIIRKAERRSERIATQDKYIFIGILTVCLFFNYFSITILLGAACIF